MPTIIGCTKLIRHLRAEARSKKSKATGAYKARNQELPEMGYSHYQEYLKSPEWAEIRKRILDKFPVCCCCDRPASQVHHYDYHELVMLGLCDEFLVPICETCHKEVEFKGNGTKRTLVAAQGCLNQRLKPEFLARLRVGRKKTKRVKKKPKLRGKPTKSTSRSASRAIGDGYRNRSKNKH